VRPSGTDDDAARIAAAADEVAAWWSTEITRIEPGIIELRGFPIEQLISGADLPSVIWLLLRGEMPAEGQARLLEAALVSSVDHGPQAPSIAAARMAATCGVGLNSAVATGVNLLGDVHGGAGQQFMTILADIRTRESSGEEPHRAMRAVVKPWLAQQRYVPGFGHRVHPVDPRRKPLFSLLDSAVADGVIDGCYLRITRSIEALLTESRRPAPINIDGCTATVYAELGFPPELGRGLFVLSRAVGILAHAWEEQGTGRRIKGPFPPTAWARTPPRETGRGGR
jgi:citrate synthase